LKRFIKNYWVLFLSAAVIVTLDQFTKAIVRNNIPLDQIWSPWPWLTPYARIVHLSNTGVAFGMFQGLGPVFAILSLIISGAIIYYFPRVDTEDWALRVALCMELGGAVGNLIDRVTQGYVTDFVSVGNFAVFNVADSCITVGVGVLILGIWLQERRKKKDEAIQVVDSDPHDEDGRSSE
jgi:signal peptidase II